MAVRDSDDLSMKYNSFLSIVPSILKLKDGSKPVKSKYIGNDTPAIGNSYVLFSVYKLNWLRYRNTFKNGNAVCLSKSSVLSNSTKDIPWGALDEPYTLHTAIEWPILAYICDGLVVKLTLTDVTLNDLTNEP